MRLQAVLFDMDGTLLDAAGTEYDMWDLRPELEAERGRLDGVLLSDFEG